MKKFGISLLDTFNLKKSLEIGYKVKSENCDIEQTLCGFIIGPKSTPDFKLGTTGLFDTTNFNVGYHHIFIKCFVYNSSGVLDSAYVPRPIAKIIRKGEGKVRISSYIIIHGADAKTLVNYQHQLLIKRASPSLVIKPENRFENTGDAKYYILNEDDIIFEREGDVYAIGYSFLCLCSYINPINGNITYTLQSPDSIYPLVNDEEV